MSGSSGIARSLTTRVGRKKSVADISSPITASGLSRAFSSRKASITPARPEISLPVELLSATNPLAFSAPDIHSHSNPASASSPLAPQQLGSTPSRSSLRSDHSVPGLSSTSSVSSPIVSGVSTPVNEIPDHDFPVLQHRLTSLPEVEDDAASKVERTRRSASSTTDDHIASDAPAVPRRAPSHTKRTHQALHRQRSVSRMRSSSISTDASAPSLAGDNSSRKSSSSSQHQHLSVNSAKTQTAVARSSVDMFSARTHLSASSSSSSNNNNSGNGNVASDSPFSAELAQLTEVAEEFSSFPARPAPLQRSTTTRGKQLPTEPSVWDEENEYLVKHGLKIFSAEDYMAEIGSPYEATFSEEVQWL